MLLFLPDCYFSQESHADSSQTPAITASVDLLLRDSSDIKTSGPSKAAEEKVFSEGQMKEYKSKTSYKSSFDQFLEWLSKFLFRNTAPENILAARRILIWTIVIISAGVVLWLFLKSDVSRMIRPKSIAASFNFSNITEDLDSIDFQKKINEAVRLGDYRLALRWHYLKILFLLDKNRLIAFAPHKTNIDYSYQIRDYESAKGNNELKGKNLYQGFIQLSRIYEFVWYGKFNVGNIEYPQHAADFERFEQQINV